MRVAASELVDAARYYEGERTGLGDEFLKAVGEAVATIQRDTETWAYWQEPVRSFRVARFPYRLLYWEVGDIIRIVAVAHLSRRPGYWKSRIR